MEQPSRHEPTMHEVAPPKLADAEPTPSPPVADPVDDPADARDWVPVAGLIAIMLMLGVCIVLALIASNRAPV